MNKLCKISIDKMHFCPFQPYWDKKKKEEISLKHYRYCCETSTVVCNKKNFRWCLVDDFILTSILGNGDCGGKAPAYIFETIGSRLFSYNTFNNDCAKLLNGAILQKKKKYLARQIKNMRQNFKHIRYLFFFTHLFIMYYLSPSHNHI